MRTVRFTFTGVTEDVRAVAEQIVHTFANGSLDVHAELVLEGRRIVGLTLAGEHELVSMASERVRKALKSENIPFLEQQASLPDEGETNARALLENLAARRPASEEPSPERAGDDEEEEEYDEYDLEELSRAEYGQYPLTASPVRDAARRTQESDETLRTAREQLLTDPELGIVRRRSKSAEERRRLTFLRGMKSGKAFYRMGMHEDAERNLQAALKANRADAELHFYLGLVCDNLGKPDQAERHLRRAITLDPDVGSNHFYLANLLQKQGKLDKAVTEYKRAIERDPDVAIVYNNLAWVFYQQGDHERSLRSFETAISMDPDLPFPHNGLACVYQEMGALPDAVSAFRKAIELYPDYAAAHLKLGWCLLQLGEIEPAIQAFRAVLDASEDSEYVVSANYSLGHSYLAQGHLIEAQEAFQKVVAEDDDDFVDALLHLGIIRVRLGFARSAIALLRKYLRKAGDSASDQAWRYLANAYFQADQLGAALRACQRALQHDSEDGDAYELLGQIAAAQGKWVAAERHLRRALELAPESATAWFHLGWIFENKKDRTQAAQAYRKSIQRDPKAAGAYNALGRLYAEEGKRDEALVLYEKALEFAPADVGVLNNLGWLHTQTGALDEALACYSRALGIEPENALVRCSVGALYLQMGRRDDAERELRRVLQLESEPRAVAKAHYFLAMLARSRQNVSNLIEHLEQAVHLDAELGVAWFRLGEALLDDGDLSHARRALERYLDLEPQGEFAGCARQYVLERLAGVSAARRAAPGGVSARKTPATPRPKKRAVRPRVRRAR